MKAMSIVRMSVSFALLNHNAVQQYVESFVSNYSVSLNTDPPKPILLKVISHPSTHLSNLFITHSHNDSCTSYLQGVGVKN